MALYFFDSTEFPGALVFRDSTVAYVAQVGDIVAPVISLNGAASVSVDVGDVYVDAGATAFDETDGDITGDILVVNPVNVNVAGTYQVTYSVADAAGNNAVPVVRTVEVVVVADVVAPVISLVGPALIMVEPGDAYVDLGATAADGVDGDITGDIVVVNPVNVNLVGSYQITYNVADAAGNNAVEVVRTVVVGLSVGNEVAPVTSKTYRYQTGRFNRIR